LLKEFIMGVIKDGLGSLKIVGVRIPTLIFGVILLAIAGWGGWYYFSHQVSVDNDKRSGSKNRPVSVVVGEVKRGDITVSLNALGTVVPRNSVTVYPQVSGVLTNVYFKEGDSVQAGQVLAQIDPRAYEASLKQAQGALERDKMLLRNAEIDLKRYETLIAQDSVSQQVYETQKALVDQYRGATLTDQGLVEAAKLQVEFARITSPIAGRIGLRQVDPGNLIQANNSTSLFVITQISPTTVLFSVPQNLLSIYLQKLNIQSSNIEGVKSKEYKKSGHSGAESQNTNRGPTKSGEVGIEAWDSDNKILLDIGRLDSIDNIIDLTTGTVKLRALFPNVRGNLFANQFVNVRSILEVRKEVVYMPSNALQKGTIGTFVYRVNEDGKTVSVVPVKLGPTDEDKIQVESGLNPGDKIVVDGLDKLREGANISIGEPARASKSRGGGTDWSGGERKKDETKEGFGDKDSKDKSSKMDSKQGLEMDKSPSISTQNERVGSSSDANSSHTIPSQNKDKWEKNKVPKEAP
jgi:multidrug efflux system membrane fusion protein